MKFQSLTIEHFMPFRERVTLPLSDQGLVLVQGDNRVSQAASSNGVGKSAIVDALSWVLYGQTLPKPQAPTGYRADEVACRFTDAPCLVRLVTDGLTIERGRRPKLLEAWGSEGREHHSNVVLDDKMVQGKIDQRIGFGWNTFRHAVVFGQGVPERFAVADQAEQMRMVDEIQGVDFRKALDRAKAWRDEWAEKLDEISSQRALLDERVTQAEASIRDLDASRERFQTEKATRLAVLARFVESARTALDQARVKVIELDALAKRAARTLAEEAERGRLQTACRDAESALAVARAERQAADNAVAEGQRRLQDLLRQSRCPTCYRPIKKGSADVQEAAAAVLKPMRDAVVAAAEREGAAKAKHDKAAHAAEAHCAKHLSLVADAVAARSVAQRQEMAADIVANAERELTQHEANVRTEQARGWEGATLLATQRKVVADAQEELATLAQSVAKASATIRAAEYWVEAFSDRGIRSLLFDSVAGFLTERAAYHLERLAAGEALLEVSALTKLKSGAMKERLSVAANWGWGAGSYGGSSAGQGGRLDLALLAALQDLAERRSAHPFPLRCFDEPEAHLDARGKEMLAAWISEEARKRGTALLMTHDTELLSMVEPDHVWTVVLCSDGARVELS